MITKVINIGNSRGIRLPKSIIEQSGLIDEAELIVQDDKIIIKPVSKTRENWENEFQIMRQKDDDMLLNADSLNHQIAWDIEEWDW